MPFPNVWMERRVIAYAHQGGAWERPSSTLAAIEHALAVGASAIELDVHATSDGRLVVCHDTTVDRTTNGSGAIAAMTLSEVRRLDPAYWFIPGADVTPGRPAEEYPYRGRGPEDPMFRIATLDEVLQRFPGVVLNLDIKRTAPVVQPYEATLAQLLRKFDRRDDVIVASFLDPSTEAFHRAAPEIPTSAGTMTVAAFWRAVQQGEPPPTLEHCALQVPERRGDLVIVDERFVEAAHAQGVAVHVWTVNQRDAMERLLDLGVDGIITDLPTTLRALLDKTGSAWVPPGSPGGPQG